MKKYELETGMVVELRNGNKYILIGEDFCRPKGKMELDSYGNDLKNINNLRKSHEWDVMVVYRVRIMCALNYLLSEHETSNNLEEIWRRESIKKLTLEDIQKELGYKFELVDGIF